MSNSVTDPKRFGPVRDPCATTTLSIIATPIGNLKDITLRALDALREADLILCEDTRVTRRLLAHFGIADKILWRLNENSEANLRHLTRQITGKNVALVSDSGTPAVSDPGGRFVDYLTRELRGGFKIIPVPGPSALTAAIGISGMARDGFVFLGFLGRSKTKIVREIGAALGIKKAAIFYESPHRIINTLEIIAERWPEAQILLTRELTKEHEQVLKGLPAAVLQTLQAQGIARGEFTVVLEDRNSSKIPF
ncbi:MAG: 16S rRNA (cytidine(1402)-2'-O)-methyltransferase [Elusimicrobiota bacterium]